MARSLPLIVSDIKAFRPSGGNWRPLDALFAELWATGEAGRHVSDLLGVLERFPEGDGADVLWSAVHGVEAIAGYEPEVIRSVRRQPSTLGVTMIGRLLNRGVSHVDGVCLVGLLEEVAASETAPDCVRASAAGWAARCR